jgi:hypothetical protein
MGSIIIDSNMRGTYLNGTSVFTGINFNGKIVKTFVTVDTVIASYK